MEKTIQQTIEQLFEQASIPSYSNEGGFNTKGDTARKFLENIKLQSIFYMDGKFSETLFMVDFTKLSNISFDGNFTGYNIHTQQRVFWANGEIKVETITPNSSNLLAKWFPQLQGGGKGVMPEPNFEFEAAHYRKARETVWR